MVRPICFTRAARIGFRAALRALELGPRDSILLPAYIGRTDREGSGVLDPVLAAGCAPAFYAVDLALRADMASIRSQLAAGHVKALLVIHYFGIIQNDMRELRQLCDTHGVVLIEDCAHAWRSSWQGRRAGGFGDYAFGSIHKYLPSMDGGFVEWADGASPCSITDRADAISLEALMAYTTADYEAIAARRIANYKQLASRLHAIDGAQLLFPDLVPGSVPLNLPVLVNSMPREDAYWAMINRGIPVIALYYRLIDQIDRETFPRSYQLSERILNLPTHQDLSADDIDAVAESFAAALSA